MTNQYIDLKQQVIQKNQHGFTLIELMIAIVLGLLVVAAALAIFLSGQRSLNTQTGMSELQQNSIFGLSQLTHDLRHTNLNTTTTQQITKTMAGGGVIFSATNSAGINDKYVTKVNETATNMNVSSDQLTIQFQPTSTGMVNCEGTELLNNTTPTIQRYYLEETVQGSGVFDLKCDAGGSNGATLGNGAHTLIQNVEAFKVRFGVKTATGLQYKTFNDLTDTDKIISLEVGVLARSSNSVGAGSGTNAAKEFNLAGQTVQVSNATQDGGRFIRESFNQVVALRNGEGG